MQNIPEIKIQIDKEKDKELFHKFLNHPNFPQHRNIIFKAFKDLEASIQKKGEGEAINDLVDSFYTSHKKIINNIVDKSINNLEKYSKKSLKKLAMAMEYNWKDGIIYTAQPTILPFSPFGENIFYFSILPTIKNTYQKSVLEIALHEISHFIFLDQLDSIGVNLNIETIYFLKEALTTVILNKDEFKEFGINEQKGNPEIRDIRIKYKEIEYSLIKFVSYGIYEKGYYQGLLFIIKLFKQTENAFTKKMNIWKKYGKGIYNKPEILTEYYDPIEIKI